MKRLRSSKVGERESRLDDRSSVGRSPLEILREHLLAAVDYSHVARRQGGVPGRAFQGAPLILAPS